MKKLALVLGGGAAKGYAHIGVLKILEKNGIIPDLVVGTSMGALIGAMYCAGNSLSELEEMALKFNSLGNFSIHSTLFKGNVLKETKAKKIITKMLRGLDFKECKIPFACVSTELNTGKQKVFKSGDLTEAVMASISIPGVYPCIKKDGNLYCDGGLVNNLPEDVAKEILPQAIVVSIDVIGDYSKQLEKLKMKTVETILNASTLMTSNLIKNRPQFADLRIVVPVSNVSQLDFSRETGAKTIAKGELSAKHNLKAIKQLLEIE